MANDDRDDNFSAYRDAVRYEVCRVCLDGRGDGSCGLQSHNCPIDARLPLVVEAVRSVASTDLDDYSAAVREKVCSQCSTRLADGSCALREHADCALVAYLPLLVDALDGQTPPGM